MRIFVFFAFIFATISGNAYATNCGDGLAMLGRTLPYVGLETNDRKIAHNMLRKAHNEYAQGHDRQCKLIAGEIIWTYVLKRPAEMPRQASVTAQRPSDVAFQTPDSRR